MTRHATVLLGLIVAAGTISARGPVARPADEVRIDRVEIAAQYTTVHFDTEPNRTYTVEAAYEFPATNWVAIYTARAFPFANHYVVADERTNAMRFYRLYVVP
jgi:hypothetical protein